MKSKFLRIIFFFIFPASVFLFSFFIGHVLGAYDIFPWIDIPMHFLGGLSVAYTSILFLNFFKQEGMMGIHKKNLQIFITLSFVSLIAVLWEFWEFGMDYFFHTNMQQGLADTMMDLFCGLTGGFAGAVFFSH